jgi:L-alanine-DL-glutamate epimerase-like enolase superfamily enzyme
MRLIDAVVTTASIRSPIRNAVVGFDEMTVSVVALITDQVRNGERLTGYGFTSNGRYAVSGPLNDRFVPRLLRAKPEELLSADRSNFDPHRAWQVMMRAEKPGGHGDRAHAVGVLDMALWDLVAKVEGRPLYRVLADRYRGGTADERVFVYAAGGYYAPGKEVAELQDECRSYVDMGFTTVKIKIGGEPLAVDLRRIEGVLAILDSPDQLAVDANARYGREAASEVAAALQPYGLRWYEEPVDPLDYYGLSAVAAEYEGALATGENLFSARDVENLLRFGGLRLDRDVLQFDLVLSYGIVEYLRILAVLDELGWDRRRCIPHGGHQAAIHAAAGLGLGGNEIYPGVFKPFGLLPNDSAPVDGYVRPTDAPGIGFELIDRLYEVLREATRS